MILYNINLVATNFEQKMQAAASWKTMFKMARGRMICFTGITVMAPNVKFSPLPSCIPKTWGCGVGPPLEPSIHDCNRVATQYRATARKVQHGLHQRPHFYCWLLGHGRLRSSCLCHAKSLFFWCEQGTT